MRFTIDDKHLFAWMWVKKYIEKRICSSSFWQKMKCWWGKDTDQNISAIYLTLLIFAAGWALCGRPQPEHESVMPLLSLSPLNVLILSSVRKHLQKLVCFILFIYSQAFNNNVISNGKSYCCNDTFTDVRFTSLVANNI